MNNEKATIEILPAKKRRGGRPTIRRPGVLRVILEAAATGAAAKACCAAAGISYDAFRSWCIADAEIEEQSLEARKKARVEALRVLQEAGPKDWRAAAEVAWSGHCNVEGPSTVGANHCPAALNAMLPQSYRTCDSRTAGDIPVI